MGDPVTTGIVGAFCALFTCSACLDFFLERRRAAAASPAAASPVILSPLHPVVAIAAQAVQPNGTLVATSAIVTDVINLANSTGAAKGGTRRNNRRSKRRQRGGVQFDVKQLQDIFDEVMSTVAPTVTGFTMKETYAKIQTIVERVLSTV
jgi:hypothetical protein